MTNAATPDQVPRPLLIAAAVLIGVTMLAAGVGRLSGIANDPPQGAPLASRDLRFDDESTGAVAVLDAQSGQMIAELAPGSNGFLRASLRSLARRRLFAAETSRSFHLTAWSDGRLTLDDPESGGVVDLEAFGATNEAVFARFLQFRSSSR